MELSKSLESSFIFLVIFSKVDLFILLFQDIINSLVTAIFMIIISVLALIPETTTCSIFGGVNGSLSGFFL